MDGLSTAASVVAVVQITAEVAKLCGSYLHEVKNAHQDIERMKEKALALHDVLERLNNTPESNANKAAIQRCFDDLRSLKEKLEPKGKHTSTKHFWVRALKWPFSRKEADKTLKELEGYLLVFNMALQLNINDRVDDAETERLLGRLACVGDASFSSYENQRHRPCLENTRVEVLEQIMQWATSTSPRCIFWLRGMAGTGKSTVAITVASRLRHVTNFASYFFKRGFGDLAHAQKLIPTIVRQLSNSSAPYRQVVLATVKANPDLGQSANLREQYEKLVVEPLSKLQSLTPTQPPFFLVIGALDECDEVSDLRLLLRLLATTKDLPNLRIRVFVTSRPDLPIRLGFQEMPSILHQDLVLHDVPRSIVNGDIEIFLRCELKDIQREYCLPANWPGDSQLSALVRKAEGLFIFAATACRYIGGSPQADPDERLEHICSSVSTNQPMTKKLDQMYTSILQYSVKGEYTKKERQRINLRFCHIVGSIVVLLNSLSIPELFKLLRDAQLQAQNQLERVLEALHAVLDIPENIDCPVQTLHLSFRDFLLDQSRCLDHQFWVDEQKTHHRLALDCMRLLSSSLQRNICRLPSLGTLKSEIPQIDVDSALSPAVQYACRYWTDHVEEGKVELLDHGCVHEFLQQHLLHWLEAMSLMGRISEAVIAIMNMAAMVNSQKSPIMHNLIHDYHRFLLAFRQVIVDAPAQLYASALLFSPLQSTVRKVFRDIVPAWVNLQPPYQQKWSSGLQTLEGHSDMVTAVKFSPDGKLMASGSSDHTVRLWNAQTGECCSVLEGHSKPMLDVVFSPDGQLVVSGSSDHTVRFWNAQTGECCSILEGHSDWVNAVCFSPDGKLVASGSDDCTVRLWDAQSGECCSVLEGHSQPVKTMGFSPDGKLVASGSYDCTVRLWNVQTGKCCSILEGHSDWVSAVVFSPDGKLVASGSDDHAVRLWDTQRSECCSILDGHSDRVNAVVFSPDGKLVASGSDDHAVRLWDTQRSECCSILDGHSDWVRAVNFSPDGKLVASGSDDCTVRLWDAQAGKCCSVLEGHSDWVNVVVFSPNGKLVASGSTDDAVRLWDAQTHECGSIVEGHCQPVSAVGFSPDGKLVASGSNNCTVQLWDVQSGECCSILEGHSDWVKAVNFSPDGKLVASGSDDCTVRLWDAQSGECCSILEGHSVWVRAVNFSPDGKLVASGSDDCTVRLWDAQTGKCCSILEGHFSWVNVVVFSPNGKLVASGSADDAVRLWDTQTGECCSILKGHSWEVSAVVFSPDSQLVASGSVDYTVRLWDARTGKHVSTIPNSGSRPAMEFHTELDLIFVNGTAFDSFSGKITKAVAYDSSRFTSNIHIPGDKNWVTKSSERVLWLPPEYRARTYASHGNTIVFGLSNGHVSFLSLEDELGH